MNTFTNKDHFTESPEYILKNCDLLIPNNCIIYEGVLYERLYDEHTDHMYRFFFCCDDYDYLENTTLERLLNLLPHVEDEYHKEGI